MIADLDTQVGKLSALRQKLTAAGLAIQDALARSQEIAQEVQALQQALKDEDSAPPDATSRLGLIDILRERRNRQETAAVRLIALRQELLQRCKDIAQTLNA